MMTEWTTTGIVAILAVCMSEMVFVKPMFDGTETDAEKYWLGLIFGLSTVLCLLSVFLFTILYVAFNQVPKSIISYLNPKFLNPDPISPLFLG